MGQEMFQGGVSPEKEIKIVFESERGNADWAGEAKVFTVVEQLPTRESLNVKMKTSSQKAKIG
jgi:hypothetical protein